MPFLASTAEPLSVRAGARRAAFGADGVRGIVTDQATAVGRPDPVGSFRGPFSAEPTERWQQEEFSAHSLPFAPERTGGMVPNAASATVFSSAPPSSSSLPTASASPHAAPGGAASALLLKAWENVEALRSSAVGGASTGRSHQLELRLDLDGDAAPVILKLRLTDHGEVQTILRTDSAELRQALEQHWGQFSQRAHDAGLRVAELRFETATSAPGSSAASSHPAAAGAGGQDGANQQQSPPRREPFAAASPDDGEPRFSLSSRPSAPLPFPTADVTARRRGALSSSSSAATDRAWQAWA